MCLYPQIKFDVLSTRTGQPIDEQLAFNIDIKDINDNAPTFLPPTMDVKVNENLEEGEYAVCMAQRVCIFSTNTQQRMEKLSWSLEG